MEANKIRSENGEKESESVLVHVKYRYVVYFHYNESLNIAANERHIKL